MARGPGAAPDWVRLDHDGMTVRLAHPWWVLALALSAVPGWLAVAALPWLLRGWAVGWVPEARGWGTGALALVISLFALWGLVATIVEAVVVAAPVELHLRGPTLRLVRRVVGRAWVRTFDLRHTRVREDEDRSSVRLTMRGPGGEVVDEVVSIPVPYRRGGGGWLGRALRAAVEDAAGPSADLDHGDREALDALMARAE